jgi:hypothetical protein
MPLSVITSFGTDETEFGVGDREKSGQMVKAVSWRVSHCHSGPTHAQPTKRRKSPPLCPIPAHYPILLLSHQHAILACPDFSQMGEMDADLLLPQHFILSHLCFLQIFSIGMFYSQKRACRVSAEGERNLLTRPMRLPPHCKSPILQHCPPSMSLTVCCPRILQASDYSIGPEVGEAHPPECRTMLC